MNFAAALLAGGRSTRMGQDKAWLLWQGEPLAKRQLRVLSETGAEVLLLSCRQEQIRHAAEAENSMLGVEPEAFPLTPALSLQGEGASLGEVQSGAAKQSPSPHGRGEGVRRGGNDVENSMLGVEPNVLGVADLLGFDSKDSASPRCSPSPTGRGEGVRGGMIEADNSLLNHTHLIIFDPPDSDEGPLGGIVRCLQTTDLPLFVLAVDMPHMTSAFLRERLLAEFDDEHGLVFRGAHGFEPLAAIYTPSMLPLFGAALQSGRLGLQSLIAEALELGLMKVIDMKPADEPFFRNVNTPADIAEDKFAAPVQMIRFHRDGAAESIADLTAREEPLEIRVQGRNVAVVMRTPGHDRELAAGFLLSEGVVQRADQILDIIKCPGTGRSKGNIVDVLTGDAEVDWGSLTRHVFSASSCGLCGKTSIDSVFQRFAPVTAEVKATPDLLWSLADKVRSAQATFTKTGGLHACAIFDLEGNLVVLREDVGRHNALDKVLGYALLHDLLPFDRHILFLSGRVSFEMMQKALAAGVPILAAISAPSSLAVQFADASNQTLIGFLRDPTLNVYTHSRRVKVASTSVETRTAPDFD